MKRIILPAALLILAMFGAYRAERIVIAPDDVWQPVYRLDPAPTPRESTYYALYAPSPPISGAIENACTTLAIARGTAQCQ